MPEAASTTTTTWCALTPRAIVFAPSRHDHLSWTPMFPPRLSLEQERPAVPNPPVALVRVVLVPDRARVNVLQHTLHPQTKSRTDTDTARSARLSRSSRRDLVPLRSRRTWVRGGMEYSAAACLQGRPSSMGPAPHSTPPSPCGPTGRRLAARMLTRVAERLNGRRSGPIPCTSQSDQGCRQAPLAVMHRSGVTGRAGANNLSTSGPGPITRPGTLFEGLPLGVAACVLSLSTNIFTTLLVAYRAWESGRRFKEYLVAKVGGSRVEKLLALLIESGAIYSAIWAVVVAYQVGDFKYEFAYVYPVNPIGPQPAVGRPSATESRFLDIFGVMMTAALVPVIAIYPAIIIVLVALDSSHMERGLTVQHLESLPTPHLALTIDTVAASLRESRLNRTSEVPAEQLRGLRGGDGSDPDESESQEASRRTSVERMQKAKEVICSPTARNV